MTKTYDEAMDDMAKFGFELAIRYAQLAEQYGDDPIKYMQEKLNNWDKDKDDHKS